MSVFTWIVPSSMTSRFKSMTDKSSSPPLSSEKPSAYYQHCPVAESKFRRVASSLDSCSTRFCKRSFSAASSSTLCCVSILRILALSLLFLTARLFLSRLCLYSSLSFSNRFFPLPLDNFPLCELGDRLPLPDGTGVPGGLEQEEDAVEMLPILPLGVDW